MLFVRHALFLQRPWSANINLDSVRNPQPILKNELKKHDSALQYLEIKWLVGNSHFGDDFGSCLHGCNISFVLHTLLLCIRVSLIKVVNVFPWPEIWI